MNLLILLYYASVFTWKWVSVNRRMIFTHKVMYNTWENTFVISLMFQQFISLLTLCTSNIQYGHGYLENPDYLQTSVRQVWQTTGGFSKKMTVIHWVSGWLGCLWIAVRALTSVITWLHIYDTGGLRLWRDSVVMVILHQVYLS